MPRKPEDDAAAAAELDAVIRGVVAKLAIPPTDDAIGKRLVEAMQLPAAAAAREAGRILLDAGLAKEAEPVFEALARSYPGMPAGAAGLAQTSMRRGAWSEALARWEGVLANFAEKRIPAWLGARARTLIELDRVEEGRAALEALVRDFPAAPSGLSELAQLAARQQNWSEAIDRWDDLLERFDDPASRPFWETARAAALFELGQTSAAEAALRALVQAHPGLFQPFWQLLRLLVAAGSPGQALGVFESSAFRWIAAPGLAEMRCQILISLRRLGDARAVFVRLLEAAGDVESIRGLFPLVPQLYEGWRRTERWLALRAKLDAVPGEAEGAGKSAIMRARVHLALRDQDGFLAAMDRVDASHLGALDKMLFSVADVLREPGYPDWRKPKIFGIGLSKTGTSTLAAALAALGLPTLHWRNPLTLELISDDDLHHFSAFTDTTVCLAFEKYYYLFPNSKFIYTTRPIETWLTSIRRHWERIGLSGFEAIKEALALPDSMHYGIALRNLNQALYFNYADFTEAFHAHDRRVRRFFEDKPKDRFLEFDVFRGHGWPELCALIGAEIPAIDFPWANRALSRDQGAAAACE